MAKRKAAAEDAPTTFHGGGDGGEAAPPARVDGRRARSHEDARAKRTRILSTEYRNAAFCGDRLIAGPDGNWTTLLHPSPCPRALPPASLDARRLPCYSGLWESDADLSAHLAKMMAMSGEVRTQWVFERMRDQYYADPGPNGEPGMRPRWHYRVGGREVCKITFAAVNGVGESTLEKLQPRVKCASCIMHHASHTYVTC